MHTLSYTISPVLQQTLKRIEAARARILLHPLSASSEITLRFNVTIARIYYSLHLAQNMVSKKEIALILRKPGKDIGIKEQEVRSYKLGFDYIQREWLVSDKPIMPQNLQKLYRLVTQERLRVPENMLMEILVFLQTSREHSLIQSFIAYIQFALLNTEQDAGFSKVARLLPYMFLYKAGLDFRGLLIVEEYFYHNERLVNELKQAALRKESVTVWVEHFVESIASQLEQAAQSLEKSEKPLSGVKEWALTERQKEILTVFDIPGNRITNKKVQEHFKISQITASRDLSKLATSGLLFQYGKGRSVYYMRA